MVSSSFVNRIIEWLRLEGTLKMIEPQPLLWAGLPPTSSGCSGPHPTWPWAPPGMGHHSFSGQLCQSLTALWGKNFLLTSSLNLPFFSLKPSLPCSITIRLYEKLVPHGRHTRDLCAPPASAMCYFKHNIATHMLIRSVMQQWCMALIWFLLL